MTDSPDWQFKLASPPKPKGFWVIGKSNWGQTQFAMHTKPNRLHRLMTKLLLGWDWLDND